MRNVIPRRLTFAAEGACARVRARERERASEPTGNALGIPFL